MTDLEHPRFDTDVKAKDLSHWQDEDLQSHIEWAVRTDTPFHNVVGPDQKIPMQKIELTLESFERVKPYLDAERIRRSADTSTPTL